MLPPEHAITGKSFFFLLVFSLLIHGRRIRWLSAQNGMCVPRWRRENKRGSFSRVTEWWGQKGFFLSLFCGAKAHMGFNEGRMIVAFFPLFLEPGIHSHREEQLPLTRKTLFWGGQKGKITWHFFSQRCQEKGNWFLSYISHRLFCVCPPLLYLAWW